MPPPDIKSLSVPELLALRSDIDNQLEVHRTELKAQLAQISNANGKANPVRGTRVPPKYRHPKTGQTWSGRGGVAGWLTREIDAGHKREDFLIDKPAGKVRGKARTR